DRFGYRLCYLLLADRSDRRRPGGLHHGDVSVDCAGHVDAVRGLSVDWRSGVRAGADPGGQRGDVLPAESGGDADSGLTGSRWAGRLPTASNVLGSAIGMTWSAAMLRFTAILPRYPYAEDRPGDPDCR